MQSSPAKLLTEDKQSTVGKTLVMPIDWGLAFALAHKWQLLLLAIFPTLIELGVGYYVHSNRLLTQHLLVVFVVTALAKAWMLSVALMLCIDVLREQKRGSFALALRALPQLPKVVVSYLATLFLVIIGLRAFVLPGLVFIGFLVWAPAFCIGELCVAKRRPRANGHDDSDILETDENAQQTSFVGKNLFDLGLVRSAKLAGNSYNTSFQLTLLVLAANVIPAALIDLLSGAGFSFSAQAIKIIMTSLLSAIVVGVWAGTFIMLLPGEAKGELGIRGYHDPHSFYSSKKKRLARFEGRIIPHMVLVVATVFSAVFIIDTSKQRLAMPSSVLVEVENTELKGSEFIVSLRLEDSFNQFRWLVPESFRVSFPDYVEPIPSAESDASTVQTTVDTVVPLASSRLFTPERYVAFDRDGIAIGGGNISPYYGPLKLTITFTAPPGLPEKGNFELSYVAVSEPGSIAFSGAYGESW